MAEQGQGEQLRVSRHIVTSSELLYVFPRSTVSLTLMAELQCDWTVPVDPSELFPRRGLVTALCSGR